MKRYAKQPDQLQIKNQQETILLNISKGQIGDYQTSNNKSRVDEKSDDQQLENTDQKSVLISLSTVKGKDKLNNPKFFQKIIRMKLVLFIIICLALLLTFFSIRTDQLKPLINQEHKNLQINQKVSVSLISKQDSQSKKPKQKQINQAKLKRYTNSEANISIKQESEKDRNNNKIENATSKQQNNTQSISKNKKPSIKETDDIQSKDKQKQSITVGQLRREEIAKASSNQSQNTIIKDKKLQKDSIIQKVIELKNMTSSNIKLNQQQIQLSTANNTLKQGLLNITQQVSKNVSAQLKQNMPQIKKQNKIFNKFLVEQKVFLYPKKQEQSSYLNQLQLENNKYFGKISNFTVYILNDSNYRQHINSGINERLQNIIVMLKQRSQNPKQRTLLHSLNQVIRKLILFTILKQNGGIVITKPLTITEDFSWIQNIQDNIYVNRGHDYARPQVVGFYSPALSSQKSHQTLKRTENPISYIENEVVALPNLQIYFIAAKKGSLYINDLVEQLYQMMEKPIVVKQYFVSKQYDMKGLNEMLVYSQFVTIASKKIIQAKQNQLHRVSRDRNHRALAIDYYGLFLINRNYAPYKLEIFWEQKQILKIYQSLARYDYEQLSANIGPMKYLAFLSPQNMINSELTLTKEGKEKKIMKGSFLHKFLFQDRMQTFIQQNKEHPYVDSSSQPWDTLPRIIWVYWDQGIKNSGISNQVCFQNLKKFGNQSGFKVNQLNDQNLNEFLDKQVLQKIKYSLDNAKVQTFIQSKSDLYRLAIIAKHGGIYLDASYIALQNFDWLINIGSYPSQYIFNRYGSLPKVLMMFHPHYGSPLDWSINQQINSKVQWHLAYQNNLIIAEKDTQLIKQWLQLYLQLLLKPYSQISKIFQENLISKHVWTTLDNQYLLAMDTIKCVIGRREVWLKAQDTNKWSDASDYYKIWSMSGYLGQQKLRSNTNFQNPNKQDNYFLTRYSQTYVEGLLGKFRHLVKFYNHQSKEVSQFIKQGFANNFNTTAHPESIFMKYMYDTNFKFTADGYLEAR